MIMLMILLTGLMAGIYFAFSVFIMKSLHQLPAILAAQVMNAINDTIVKTLFLPIFFVSTLMCVGLLFWSLVDWQPVGSWLVISAAFVYVMGMFAVTVVGNVPLNNRLRQHAESDDGIAEYWVTYRRVWTQLNHVRTISCTLSCALLILALNQ